MLQGQGEMFSLQVSNSLVCATHHVPVSWYFTALLPSGHADDFTVLLHLLTLPSSFP